MTKKEILYITKRAQAAIKREFNLTAKLADITLLERSSDCNYILFRIGKYEYEYNTSVYPNCWIVGD